MNSSFSDAICAICQARIEEGENVVKIGQKGADGINSASIKRGDTITVTTGDAVHCTCRKSYINIMDINLSLKRKQGCEASTTRAVGSYNNKTDCLFCCTSVKQGSAEYSCVKTDNFTKTILQCCDNRCDDWSVKVKGRIQFYNCDLHAADCVYHQTCSSHFRCGRDIPLQFQTNSDSKRRKPGRPKDDDQAIAYI